MRGRRGRPVRNRTGLFDGYVVRDSGAEVDLG